MVGHETMSPNLIREAQVSLVRSGANMEPLEAIKVYTDPQQQQEKKEKNSYIKALPAEVPRSAWKLIDELVSPQHKEQRKFKSLVYPRPSPTLYCMYGAYVACPSSQLECYCISLEGAGVGVFCFSLTGIKWRDRDQFVLHPLHGSKLQTWCTYPTGGGYQCFMPLALS